MTDLICILCEEPIEEHQFRGHTSQPTHRECGLRVVLGGIGHLIDHPHYCLEKHDPDAGMSFRESALMVWTWVQIKGGVEEALKDQE